MKLIVGLGNPGKKFARTRHNVGHMFISKIKNQISKLQIKDQKVWSQVKFHETTVFMNNSGEEIKKLAADCRLQTADLLIVHDDMDLPLGDFKLQLGRGAAGHKGVQSVIDALGTRDFWRLRIGIGRDSAGVPSEDYVLSQFSTEEISQLQEVFGGAFPRVAEWLG